MLSKEGARELMTRGDPSFPSGRRQSRDSPARCRSFLTESSLSRCSYRYPRLHRAKTRSQNKHRQHQISAPAKINSPTLRSQPSLLGTELPGWLTCSAARGLDGQTRARRSGQVEDEQLRGRRWLGGESSTRRSIHAFSVSLCRLTLACIAFTLELPCYRYHYC
jgi:hypothetical protein